MEKYVFTIIKQRTQAGEVEEALQMTQEEFEQITSKYSTNRGTVRKHTPLDQRMKKAQSAAKEGEEVKIENFMGVDTEGFEKTVVLMHEWSEMILREMRKEKNFRIEITYNAEALKTDLYIYTDVKEHGLNDNFQGQKQKKEEQTLNSRIERIAEKYAELTERNLIKALKDESLKTEIVMSEINEGIRMLNHVTAALERTERLVGEKKQSELEARTGGYMEILICFKRKDKAKIYRTNSKTEAHLTIIVAVCKEATERVAKEKGMTKDKAMTFLLECIKEGERLMRQ